MNFKPVLEVANQLGIAEENLELYGRYKAKVNFQAYREKSPHGKLIMVTAMTPTPAGEGKTTTAIGLSDALSRLGQKACLTLREPSLGPVFGIKGGATGGGKAMVVPREEINLHFTGDIHAVTAAIIFWPLWLITEFILMVQPDLLMVGQSPGKGSWI